MNKKITISVLAALMIAGTTSFSAFAAMADGTVVIGTKAFSLTYANDPANVTETTQAIVDGGSSVFVKNFEGKWINNLTSTEVNASVIPAVTYKDATKVTKFDAGDKDAVTTVAVKSVSAINDTTLSVKFEGKDAVEITVPALKDGQTVVTFKYEAKEYTGTLAEAYVTVATVTETAAQLAAETAVAAYEAAPVTTLVEVTAAEALKPAVAITDAVKDNTIKDALVARIAVVDAKIAAAKVEIAARLVVKSVSDITESGFDVAITAPIEDKLNTTIVVIDNTGKTIDVNPVDIASGDTEASFEFVTPIKDNMVGIWTIGGVKVDFDQMAKLSAVYNADSQLELYNALNTLGILDVKDANIEEYVDALGNLETTVDLKDFTKVMAQNIVTKANTAALTTEQQAVIVKAVVDAKIAGNEVALLKALQNPAFERVNAAWIADYVVLPTTENSIVGIQDMINTANMVYVNSAVKIGINKTVLTASKTLITTYATPDDKDAQTKITIKAIKDINIQLAVADVVAATTPTTLKAKLTTLAKLVNTPSITVLDMTKYVNTSGKLYITAVNDLDDVTALNTAIGVVNTAVNSRVVAQDFDIMNFSGVKGYNVGFNFSEATMDTAKKVVINLYKGTTLLATATSSGLIENLPKTIQQSAPFDVSGDFDYVADGNWTYSGWNGAVTDIPTRAEIVVTFNDGIATTENKVLSGDTDIFIVETVNAATNVSEVNTALLALGDDNYLNFPSADRLYVANLVLETRNLQEINTVVTKKFANLADVQSTVARAISARNTALTGVNKLTSTNTNTTTIPVLKKVGNKAFNEMTEAGQATIAENFLNKCDFSGDATDVTDEKTLKTPFKTLAAIIGLMK